MNNSPIVIVEDDKDDCDILVNTFKEIGVKNPFRCFENPLPALEYLRSTKESPFIIISDINMPQMTGLAFKKIINEDKAINKKRIPFVFLSTSKANSLMEEAFHLSIQGYFKKPDNFNSLKELAQTIIDYWDKGPFHV